MIDRGESRAGSPDDEVKRRIGIFSFLKNFLKF